MDTGTTSACWAAHMGLLACEPRFVQSMVSAVKAGLPLPRARCSTVAPRAVDSRSPQGEYADGVFVPYYAVVGEGVAQIRVDGPTAKAWGKFGEMSTVFLRRAVRAAVADPAVASILMVFDSPGGYVAGTDDLAREVARADEQKPVVAYAEDMMASAAYYVASQARAVYANPTAMVGSIGVFAVIEDQSKAAEIAGVTVHVLSTGPLKGAGVDGTPVTDAMLEAWQTEVDDAMSHFAVAVKKGRKMGAKEFAAVSTGGVWIADKAKGLGLIDGIRSIDDAVTGMPKPKKSRLASARARLSRSK